MTYRKYINIVEAANKGCPIATHDLEVNVKHRQKAIDKHHYGPANPARDMIIGSTGATASVVFNRSIKVKNNLGALAFEVDRDGITSIFTPSGADPNKGTLNIIGTASGLTQPRGTLYDGTLIHLTAQDGKSSRISSDSFGTGTYPLYVGRAARGTV